MKDQAHGLPYRWILPIAQLLICAIALWPIRSTLLTREPPRFSFDISTIPSDQKSSTDSHLNLPLDLDSPEMLRSIRNTERRLWTPTLLDMPAGLVQLPYVISNRAKTEWVPNGMDVKRWRAITWPFVGLIFWWIAGRSVEALLAARRTIVHPSISWIETGIGVYLLLWGIIILVAPLCAGNSDTDISLVFISGSGAMWAVLGAAIVIARIAQRKIRFRLRDVQAPDALAS